MEFIAPLIDLVLHLDRHVSALLASYHLWFYGILFVVIFAETGFVVTPFLPGDSLLFAVGALTAIDTSGTLRLPVLLLLVIAAAVLGNTLNYQIGRWIGVHAFDGDRRFLKKDYLLRTEAFFQRHGGMAVVLSRFVPIVRTFAPFVAGVGRMNWARFQGYNLVGGFSWVLLFIWGGYVFGNIPLVKHNFGLVTIFVILLSLLPMVVALFRGRTATA